MELRSGIPLVLLLLLVVACAWFLSWTLGHTYEAASHNMQGAVGNRVFLHKDGHSEAVVDSSGKQVEDPANRASYNFCHPVKAPLCHFALDTFPWLIWGNALDDPHVLLGKVESILARLPGWSSAIIRCLRVIAGCAWSSSRFAIATR
jgi:hypothetical protein